MKYAFSKLKMMSSSHTCQEINIQNNENAKVKTGFLFTWG